MMNNIYTEIIFVNGYLRHLCKLKTDQEIIIGHSYLIIWLSYKFMKIAKGARAQFTSGT